MKSKKKKRRKLTGCFLLCVGQELCWVNVFFFSLLASLFNWGRIMLGSFFHQKKEEEDTRKEIKKVLKKKKKKKELGVVWPTMHPSAFFFWV
jgi:ABC-type transport system involved in cytochrome bd biosynthesis fused ATPase/permease subunit